MIRITSKKNNFRRCGVAHSSTPTVYKKDKFTAEEIERLLAEPMLVVELDYEEPGKEKSKESKGPQCNLTVPDLKERLGKLKIEFATDAKKDDLINALLNK
jgi:hypothetical protein